MDKQKNSSDLLVELELAIDHFFQLLSNAQKTEKGLVWLREIDRLCKGIKSALDKESQFAFQLGIWARSIGREDASPYAKELLGGCLYEAYRLGCQGRAVSPATNILEASIGETAAVCAEVDE